MEFLNKHSEKLSSRANIRIGFHLHWCPISELLRALSFVKHKIVSGIQFIHRL